MKRSIGVLLALLLAAGAGFAQAGRSGGHGGRAVAARPAPSGGFAHFATGPMRFTTGTMHFTTGPHPGRVVGIRPPGVIARPVPVPPVRPIHSHPGFVGGGTVIVTAPLWYPPYPYPYYYYPYVVPTYGGPVAAGVPTYSDAPTYAEQPSADAPAYPDTPGYSERNDYWYYCPDLQAYYPYVPTCPSPWMPVVPGDAAAPGQ
ncbi:MAG TPA: hypothetical protein VEH03_07480 [Burkholderiales bacterium]|nr:hypothetical protein [Burkholderiales bacterium]